MVIEIKPVLVTHEALLALHLHEQYLASEYSRITQSERGGDEFYYDKREVKEALEIIIMKMFDCQRARERIEILIEDGLLW